MPLNDNESMRRLALACMMIFLIGAMPQMAVSANDATQITTYRVYHGDLVFSAPVPTSMLPYIPTYYRVARSADGQVMSYDHILNGERHETVLISLDRDGCQRHAIRDRFDRDVGSLQRCASSQGPTLIRHHDAQGRLMRLEVRAYDDRQRLVYRSVHQAGAQAADRETYEIVRLTYGANGLLENRHVTVSGDPARAREGSASANSAGILEIHESYDAGTLSSAAVYDDQSRNLWQEQWNAAGQLARQTFLDATTELPLMIRVFDYDASGARLGLRDFATADADDALRQESVRSHSLAATHALLPNLDTIQGSTTRTLEGASLIFRRDERHADQVVDTVFLAENDRWVITMARVQGAAGATMDRVMRVERQNAQGIPSEVRYHDRNAPQGTDRRAVANAPTQVP